MVKDTYEDDITRAYSVLVHGGTSGSGVLFYLEGDTFFVFTCAHVIDNCEQIRLDLLLPVDPDRDVYRTYRYIVDASQAVYSSLDTVQVNPDGQKVHSHDVAVIPVRKAEDMPLQETEYYIAEAHRNDHVYVQGYPGGLKEEEILLDALDEAYGTVRVSAGDQEYFSIRIEDRFLDQTQRVYEMMGFSGAPVWNMQEDKCSLCGLLSSGSGQTVYRGKVYAMKAELIRSIMKTHFQIVLKRKICGVPEKDVAGNGGRTAVLDGNLENEMLSDGSVKWIETQCGKIRDCLTDLKLQAGIDIGREAYCNPEFERSPEEKQKSLMKLLLYMYEIADLDEDFAYIESEMCRRGFCAEHDTLRWISRCFGRKEYEKVLETAEEYLADHEYSPDDRIYACVFAYRNLSRAYVEDSRFEDTVGMLLDEHDNLVIKTGGSDTEALIYQMTGYVCGDKFHDYIRAVRCLNRSYEIGFDSIILESLGAAYYFLGVQDATNADGIADPEKIDYGALYKARKCFLIIMDKADNLFWSGTVKRVGLCVYNTFVFLRDNYRILMLYPQIRTYITMETPEELRDIELKYAKVLVQKGEIDLQQFDALTDQDKIFLKTAALAEQCSRELDTFFPNRSAYEGFEQRLRDVIDYIEQNICQISTEEQLGMRVMLLNFYGRGMILYKWNAMSVVKQCYAEICKAGNQQLNEQLANFVFELEHPIEETEQRYKNAFEKSPSIMSWQEWRNFYMRHRMFDQVDSMYRELFTRHTDLIADQPEYAFRGYIEYITCCQRDMIDALKCYKEAKDIFQDTEISGFLELELMALTNTFNEPERFETDRVQFLEKGLIGEEDYHRYAFIAYLANLNRDKTKEHYEYIKDEAVWTDQNSRRTILPQYMIHYLCWTGQLKSQLPEFSRGMSPLVMEQVMQGYQQEKWHRTVPNAEKKQFAISRTLIIDSWGLYVLAEKGILDTLKKLDSVYVTHPSVINLLKEFSSSQNGMVKNVLDFLEAGGNVRIQSPDFEHQIRVREKMVYNEFASCLALAYQKDCIAVIGLPGLQEDWIEYFAAKMIRVSQIEELNL